MLVLSFNLLNSHITILLGSFYHFFVSVHADPWVVNRTEVKLLLLFFVPSRRLTWLLVYLQAFVVFDLFDFLDVVKGLDAFQKLIPLTKVLIMQKGSR